MSTMTKFSDFSYFAIYKSKTKTKFKMMGTEMFMNVSLAILPKEILIALDKAEYVETYKPSEETKETIKFLEFIGVNATTFEKVYEEYLKSFLR